MRSAKFRALSLGIGAFGGEGLLLLALPLLGRHYGAEQVAMIGLGIVIANAGKMLGTLKIDAALTDTSEERLPSMHALAIVALATMTPLVAVAIFVARPWLPAAAQDTPGLLVFLFACGAIQQAASMRLLREDRLWVYACIKALPSLLLGLLGLLGLMSGLLEIYALAFALTALAAAGLHLRNPDPQLPARVAERLPEVRSVMIHGAPASGLDALNLIGLAVLTIQLAGAEAAGQATQIQRIALGASIASGLLLSQEAWRRRFLDDASARRFHLTTMMASLAAGGLSILAMVLILGTSIGQQLFGHAVAHPLLVGACLAPLLAQHIGSPLTVFFFKRGRVAWYTVLQILLLAALAILFGAVHWGSRVDQSLVMLAIFTFAATATMSRLALHPINR